MNSFDYTPSVYSNKTKGSFGIPSVGAHVWVFFHDGDPLYPVYFAASYGENDWNEMYGGPSGYDYPGGFENKSEETDNQWEGCLSIPGMLGLVKRHSSISYEGFDMSGNKIQQNAEGLHARLVQHECDHLNGIVFTHRLVDKKAYGYEDEIEEYWKKKYE